MLHKLEGFLLGQSRIGPQQIRSSNQPRSVRLNGTRRRPLRRWPLHRGGPKYRRIRQCPSADCWHRSQGASGTTYLDGIEGPETWRQGRR